MSESIAESLAALREAIERFSEAIPLEGLEGHPDGEQPGAPDAAWNQLRWRELDQHLEGQIADRRALVVGVEVSDDAAAFAARGANYVLACAQQPEGAELCGPARVDLRRFPWQQLDPAVHGTYDLVYCDGLLHRVTEPMALLHRLREMTAPGGILLVSSMMIDDPERSEYLRFIPDRYAGDPTWWFLPGRLAFRWLVQTAGFEVNAEFGEREGPRDLFPVVFGYLRATAL